MMRPLEGQPGVDVRCHATPLDNSIHRFDDGEVRQESSICLRGRRLGGEATTGDESTEVRRVIPERTPELVIDRSMRRRMAHGLRHVPDPHID